MVLCFSTKRKCVLSKRRSFFCYRLCYIPKEGGIYDALQAYPFPIYFCYAHFLFTSKKVRKRNIPSFAFGIRRKLFRPLPAPPHVKLWWGGALMSVFTTLYVREIGVTLSLFFFAWWLVTTTLDIYPKERRKEEGKTRVTSMHFFVSKIKKIKRLPAPISHKLLLFFFECRVERISGFCFPHMRTHSDNGGKTN